MTFFIGQTGTLKGEIESQISGGKALQLILPGSGLGAVDELTSIQVKVTSNFKGVSDQYARSIPRLVRRN